ncbi:MAG: PilZ domain-containing protein [Planctomycetes bacterium]|nr:PilZ domain-containing protein [Planctomycetota bacterium]
MANILIVDPSRSILSLLRSLTLVGGHRVSVADSNEAGVAKISSSLYDLLVVNLEGPRERVTPLLQVVSALVPQMPVVAVNYGAFRGCYGQFPFAGVMERPLPVVKFRRVVDRALSAREARPGGGETYRCEARADVTVRAGGASFPCQSVRLSRAGVVVTPRARAVRGGFRATLRALPREAELSARLHVTEEAWLDLAARIVFHQADGDDEAGDQVGLWFHRLDAEQAEFLARYYLARPDAPRASARPTPAPTRAAA